MPRPRFHALEPARQQEILRTAAEAFAAHGFAGASYNAIIERSGTSKGAMYYYFTDKADLYATVVLDVLGRFLHFLGPFPDVADAAAFWDAVHGLCERGFAFYDADPTVGGLVRSLGTEVPSVQAVHDLRAMSGAWFAELVSVGQRVGAVRDDLPLDLILAVAISVSEAVDLWFASRHDTLGAAERSHLVGQLVDMYRRMATPTLERV